MNYYLKLVLYYSTLVNEKRQYLPFLLVTNNLTSLDVNRSPSRVACTSRCKQISCRPTFEFFGLPLAFDLEFLDMSKRTTGFPRIFAHKYVVCGLICNNLRTHAIEGISLSGWHTPTTKGKLNTPLPRLPALFNFGLVADINTSHEFFFTYCGNDFSESLYIAYSNYHLTSQSFMASPEIRKLAKTGIS